KKNVNKKKPLKQVKAKNWLYFIIPAIFIAILAFIWDTDQQNHEISSSNKCNLETTLKKAKECTFVILRDDGGHGSGFSVSPGYLVTNKHVIEGANKLSTWINGEKELTVWNYSPTMDVAVLKLP